MSRSRIADHRLGQILWVHASCWTDPFPFAPDITTYLYQQNVNPWGGGGLGYNMKSKRVTITQKDDSNTDKIVLKISEAERDKDFLDDIDDLLSLVKLLKELDNESKPGIIKPTGRRARQ